VDALGPYEEEEEDCDDDDGGKAKDTKCAGGTPAAQSHSTATF